MTIASRRRNGEYANADGIKSGMKDLDELMREEAEAIRERETRAGKGGAINKKNQPANVQALKGVLKSAGIQVSHKQAVNMTRVIAKGKKRKADGDGESRSCHRCGRIRQDSGMSHSRSRHSCIRRAFVRENVKLNVVSFEYTQSENNMSDVLTKAVDRSKLVRHRAGLLGSSANDEKETAECSKRSKRTHKEN